MRSSRSLGTELWRAIVEHLNVGVIVFNEIGVVIYANDEAARLLGYSPRDVLELDKDDFVALCYAERLDGKRFTDDLMKGLTGDEKTQTYDLATAERRLTLQLSELDLEFGKVVLLVLSEAENWRANMIAETALSEEMHSPLVFSASYSEALIERIDKGASTPFELRNLAQISHDSVIQAMAIWQTLRRFQITDQDKRNEWDLKPIRLKEAFENAVSELKIWSVQEMPAIQVDVVGEQVAPVKASGPHLHSALCSLLDTVADGLAHQDKIVVAIRQKHKYVEAAIWSDAAKRPLHYNLFDSLPCAISEQVIIQHGGRIWLGKSKNGATAFCFRLPVANPS